MRDKVYMPKTAVEISFPVGTELFCIVVGARDDKRMECCEIAKDSKSAVRFAFPLNAFVEGLAQLPQPYRKIAALKAIMEISKAGEFDVPKEITDFPLDAIIDIFSRKERNDG